MIHALSINRIPFYGILTFVILYIYSSTLYPGGSQESIYSLGFDWINNYWCNLMNVTAVNGSSNPARLIAIAGLIILCVSLTVFFIQFAELYSQTLWKNVIKIGGILSMLFAILIFTEYHDLMTLISTFFGLFVVLGIIIEIYKSEMVFFKFFGAVCIVLLTLNNYIYYTNQFIQFLPLLQKITFAIVLTWILGINYEMRKSIRLK